MKYSLTLLFILFLQINLFSQDCGNCSNTWTTGASATFNYGSCVFYFDYEYRECEDSTDTYREFRINGLQNLTSECDTVSSQKIYEYSIKLLLSNYYQMFNVNYYDTNKVTLLSKPCITPADMSGYIDLCGEGTNCNKVDYNLTGFQEFTEVIGSKTFTRNYMLGMACGMSGPCGTEIPEVFYNVPTGPIYYQIYQNPTSGSDCDEICFWKIDGNSEVDDAFNFIGTKVEEDLRIKTNDVYRMRITSNGFGFYGNETNYYRIKDELTETNFHFNTKIGLGNPFGTDSPNNNGSISLYPQQPGSFYHIDNSTKRGLALSYGVAPGTHFQYSKPYNDVNSTPNNQPQIGSTDIMNIVSWGKKVGIGIIPNSTEDYTYNKSGAWTTTTSYGAAGPEGMLTVSDTYWHYWGGSNWEVFSGNPVILRLERRDNGYNDDNTDYKLISAGHDDSETFLVRANAKVGINTSSQDALLNIYGLGDDDQSFSLNIRNSTGDNILSARDDGYVGIGIFQPSQPLDVRIGETLSRIQLGNTESGYNPAIKMYKDVTGGANQSHVWWMEQVRFSGKNHSSLIFKSGLTTVAGSGIDPIGTETTMANILELKDDGRVVIGQDTVTIEGHYDYKLSVDGKIVAKEVVVTTSNWADYVFKPNYFLIPLSELELKISELGHLPGMPSEAEVLENGVSINEMQVKMLEKIEELTLYMIELQKQNEKLQAEVNKLKGE